MMSGLDNAAGNQNGSSAKATLLPFISILNVG
jgi:hypothetical protein